MIRRYPPKVLRSGARTGGSGPGLLLLSVFPVRVHDEPHGDDEDRPEDEEEGKSGKGRPCQAQDPRDPEEFPAESMGPVPDPLRGEGPGGADPDEPVPPRPSGEDPDGVEEDPEGRREDLGEVEPRP